MEFDIEKYSETFDRFLLRMAHLNQPSPLEMHTALEDLCEFLRVGKIQAVQYESPRHEELGQGELVTLYQTENTNFGTPYSKRSFSGRGNVTVYNLYPFEDQQVWTTLELKKLEVFSTMLHIFNGRARLLKFAETASFYDHELKIPNLAFFKRTSGELLAKGQLSSYGICFFNLKRFALVNQKLGRPLGTQVMASFVGKLQESIGDKGYVCRVGGDNFIILFEKDMLDHIVNYLEGTSVVYDRENDSRILVRASSGYYMVQENTENLEQAIEKAHMAVQSARKSIGTFYVFYNEALRSAKEKINFVESVFPEAIENEEFLVYYQPKVMLKNYRLEGAEALCRWKHDGQLVRPDDFIPILENSNLICTLDFYMLEHVCRDIRRWIDSNQNIVRVSVNLSRRHLGDEDLLDKIISIIDKYNVPHEYIEIELTETTTDVGFVDLKKIVLGLHERGIHTSVDDFGVGYSSLNLIRQLPWDVIKIDKSFLPEGEDENAVEHTMLRHLLSMLQDMGLKCIVEGVETVEQVKMLKGNNCYLAQGYYFDRPLEIKEFENRLKELGGEE